MAELEALAEDEISALRGQGREAEADRRADAWNREIARALGEANALQASTNGHSPVATSTPPGSTVRRYRRLWQRRPALALTLASAALFCLVVVARLIDAIAHELLAVSALALLLAAFVHRTRPQRRGGSRGYR